MTDTTSDDTPPDGWYPEARPDVVFRQVAGEWLLFDPDRQRIHSLNLSAALIWIHCTGEDDVDAITEAVVAAFGTEEAGEHVSPTLERFRAEGLLAK